ncbi:hypothetical protein [Chryseobacterium lathyri]|uniref:Uncharacterized protein n=1 Tax=Chryseobacterium lathyri TaxID=395933 RepID=A0ABT9SNC4_9FLAO|nr:hypothetical protein [Chryseobacterium lathyri]MDP9960296.1 hypothetical protein [Chryseobacterium lathyri]MDQ0067459.1 hypothetical protein [Chryseobacterium lathyri]
MILGVYWYFKFPENVYSFQFFNFLKGFGGHVDNPAELEARVSVDHPESFIKKLEELHFRFKRMYLDIKVNENQFLISTGDYTLFDEHFQFVSEIERLLFHHNAVLLDLPFEMKSSRRFSPENKNFETIGHRFMQITGSDFKKNNAENLSVRIDCNLPAANKKDLINDLIRICTEENIQVFYYYGCDFKQHSNLMFIFSNGRQMENSVQDVDINTFGNKVRRLEQKYPLHFGLFGGMEYYPRNGPFVELITDEEYILNKK